MSAFTIAEKVGPSDDTGLGKAVRKTLPAPVIKRANTGSSSSNSDAATKLGLEDLNEETAEMILKVVDDMKSFNSKFEEAYKVLI
jgi:HEAT repeat protein